MAEQHYPRFVRFIWGLCNQSASAEIGLTPSVSVVPGVKLREDSTSFEIRSYFSKSPDVYCMVRLSTRGNMTTGFGLKNGFVNPTYGVVFNVHTHDIRPFVGLGINFFEWSWEQAL
jgi:hypothetical protein